MDHAVADDYGWFWPWSDAEIRPCHVALNTDRQRGDWLQTDPNKRWFTVLRLFSPLEPFFNESWHPAENEVVK